MTDRPETGDPATADDRDRALLRRAIELSRLCPPSTTAFSVGCVIADRDGEVIAEGYSRRDDPHDHAEETALRDLGPDEGRLAGATLYSSLEPCGRRASRPHPCADLILATPIPRIVYAWSEPSVFVEATGAARLAGSGRSVVHIADLTGAATAPNAHLLRGGDTPSEY
ncbi:cytidine/deoxycytidylate deaminase family protein [Nocardiopsis suaedae]|uniref:dCMP deaminase n=1 Tax=Nocardiopsis suaedae TaxID=3018444 RepID=A0ABT4TEL1_9ACTN|nr:dCMP deaminase [Nocardiopsis suaedae]MDA2803066.1 dCMP deaminase [Nocardiopsis suaedae]